LSVAIRTAVLRGALTEIGRGLILTVVLRTVGTSVLRRITGTSIMGSGADAVVVGASIAVVPGVIAAGVCADAVSSLFTGIRGPRRAIVVGERAGASVIARCSITLVRRTTRTVVCAAASPGILACVVVLVVAAIACAAVRTGIGDAPTGVIR
jgi:hypothetical protein